MLSNIACLAPLPIYQFLRQLGRRVELVPQGTMQACGWNLVTVEPIDLRSESTIQRARMAIDTLILELWPNPLRVSYDRQEGEQLAIWTRALPGLNGPFPTPPDLENALRVIYAAGAARANRRAEEVMQAAPADRPPLVADADREQQAFELVAASLANLR